MLVRDEEIDAPVAIEVAEDNISRVAATGETEGCRCVREGSVEVVAIHRPRAIPDEKKIKVAIMIKIDEERFAGSFDDANLRLVRNIHEGSVASIAEQMAASVSADDEEVQPTIVVVIRER